MGRFSRLTHCPQCGKTIEARIYIRHLTEAHKIHTNPIAPAPRKSRQNEWQKAAKRAKFTAGGAKKMMRRLAK